MKLALVQSIPHYLLRYSIKMRFHDLTDALYDREKFRRHEKVLSQHWGGNKYYLLTHTSVMPQEEMDKLKGRLEEALLALENKGSTKVHPAGARACFMFSECVYEFKRLPKYVFTSLVCDIHRRMEEDNIRVKCML